MSTFITLRYDSEISPGRAYRTRTETIIVALDVYFSKCATGYLRYYITLDYWYFIYSSDLVDRVQFLFDYNKAFSSKLIPANLHLPQRAFN